MTQTVLITGASGFVASPVIRKFLEAGFKVRGTVRSESSAEKVKQLHSKYASELSFATVEDISAPGAFDEAVKGVDGVSLSNPNRQFYCMLKDKLGNSYCIAFHPRCQRLQKRTL
jgi:uncharacterized protein YbjT (DUF2867 family)